MTAFQPQGKDTLSGPTKDVGGRALSHAHRNLDASVRQEENVP